MVLTIISTLKQKRSKKIIKEQNQENGIVKKVFSTAEPLIRKALSTTLIQCSLHRFVTVFKTINMKCDITFCANIF